MPIELRSVTEIPNIAGTYIIVRSSLNVPLEEGVVRDAFRIERALPTLRYLSEQGAKIILLSHIGRKPDETLYPVYEELAKFLPVQWGGQVLGAEFSERRGVMGNGDILMAENMRQDEREAANDLAFATELAALGEMFVNDAFAEAHREQASVHALATLLPAYAGLQLKQEIDELAKTLTPEHPALFLLGGAKFETKMPLVEKFLDLYDHVFIGGALANDVLKAKGFPVGKSLVSDISLVDSPIIANPKLLVPIDVIVDGPNGVRTCDSSDVQSEEIILDCGPATTAMLQPYIAAAKTVLWNGPFGLFEKGFTTSTEATAQAIVASDAFSVLGGGDTVAAVGAAATDNSFDFVSIGGGAMLTFLEQGTTSTIDLLLKA